LFGPPPTLPHHRSALSPRADERCLSSSSFFFFYVSSVFSRFVGVQGRKGPGHYFGGSSLTCSQGNFFGSWCVSFLSPPSCRTHALSSAGLFTSLPLGFSPFVPITQGSLVQSFYVPRALFSLPVPLSSFPCRPPVVTPQSPFFAFLTGTPPPLPLL